MSKGIVVITGGTRGIGAETAVAAAGAGYDVVAGYVDPNKQKRAYELVDRVKEMGQWCVAVCADIADPKQAQDLLATARALSADIERPIVGLVLNAAGGLEKGGTIGRAQAINTYAPQNLAVNFITQDARGADPVPSEGMRSVVYVTSNPSHFYEDPRNIMPSAGYDVVAKTKHDGETRLRSLFALTAVNDVAPNNRLLVATADLVDGTAGATLLRMAHKRSAGAGSPDLLAARDAQLRELVGRGLTDAVEFGAAIVGMLDNADLPSGHTLYMPSPVLGEHVVAPSELPFGLGDPALHTFVTA